VKAVIQLIKERIGVDSSDIKYYDVDVDDWVDLKERAGKIITGLRVLKLRVESSNDEDRLETPEAPVEIPEMSVTRPKTPISRPSYKTIITMVTRTQVSKDGVMINVPIFKVNFINELC
jgi:hypothetical protein